MPASRPAAPALPPATAVLVVLGAIALFGNGLKALVTSTVLVSESAFATSLRMSPEQVATLLQTMIAGMVVALALSPLLLERYRVRALGLVACAVATAAFGAFAAIELARLSQAWRVGGALAGLALGAGALALLAPVAQALVARAPTPGSRTSLTTVWTLAAPAGFLLAPQLVKVALPAVGLGRYFAGLAALPLVMALALALVPRATAAASPQSRTFAALPVRPVLAFVAAVVAFEVWTGVGDVAGFGSAAAVVALLALVALGAVLATLVRTARRDAPHPALTGGIAPLLAALFVLQVPTTGFFDTAFLVATGHDEAFIANRATLGAGAQIAATLVAVMLAHRLPAHLPRLRMAFVAVALAGIALFVGYPWATSTAYLYAAPMVTGAGAAGLTLLLCLGLVQDAARHPLRAALPSMAIMLGTEFGLEVLQMVYAVAGATDLPTTARYAAVFAAQLAAALAVPVLLVRGAYAAAPSPSGR